MLFPVSLFLLLLLFVSWNCCCLFLGIIQRWSLESLLVSSNSHTIPDHYSRGLITDQEQFLCSSSFSCFFSLSLFVFVGEFLFYFIVPPPSFLPFLSQETYLPTSSFSYFFFLSFFGIMQSREPGRLTPHNFTTVIIYVSNIHKYLPQFLCCSLCFSGVYGIRFGGASLLWYVQGSICAQVSYLFSFLPIF